MPQWHRPQSPGMCGIAGSFALQGNALGEAALQRALDALSHRGPDDTGHYAKGRTRLGHRRLAILDPGPAGHQPFTANHGRYTIVFNGEIFNFAELKGEMEAKGEAFKTRTDTEVLLRLFAREGPACLHKLNGFFALAVHDAEQDSLFLARDRYGIKPLLWTVHNGRLNFASELKALAALGITGGCDPVSLAQYLTYFFVPSPYTIFPQVHKLAPGHTISVKGDEVKQERWYDLATAIRHAEAPTGNDLASLLEDAVRLRLVADVPVGAFLSGGVDSSIISALAARNHPQLHTFSIGYKGQPYYDETRYAEAVARHIGSEHQTFMLSTEDLAEGYLRLLDHVDEPFADSSALPSFLLSERTRRHVKVALSGDGADELFGGYRKHQALLRCQSPGMAERIVGALAPLWRNLPRSRNSAWQDRFRQLDRFASLQRASPAQQFLQLAAFTPPHLVQTLLADARAMEGLRARDEELALPMEELPGMNGALLADVRSTLPNDMLYKVDHTSMAHGLEVRPPFLDKRVVEYAFSLPARKKLQIGSGKHILRTTFGHMLPAEVMTRRKKGFEVPLLDLLRGPLHGLVDATLQPDAVAEAGLEPNAVSQVVSQLRSRDPGTSQATVHALIVYVRWRQAQHPTAGPHPNR